MKNCQLLENQKRQRWHQNADKHFLGTRILAMDLVERHRRFQSRVRLAIIASVVLGWFAVLIELVF